MYTHAEKETCALFGQRIRNHPIFPSPNRHKLAICTDQLYVA
jgi:hypothetical protein